MSKVTLITCNYNDSRFMLDWAKRVTRQGFDEIILIDDNSTDGSLDLAHFLAKKHPIIKVLESPYQRGYFDTFMHAVEAATSEYVTSFSMDDYPKEDYLKKMRYAIEDYPFVDLFTCNAEVIREGSLYYKGLFPFEAFISPEYASKIFKSGHGRQLNVAGVLMRKEMLMDIWKGVGKDLKADFDFFFILYAMFTKGIVHLKDFLYTYRSYPNSFGVTRKKKDIKEAREKQVDFFMHSLDPKQFQLLMETGIFDEKYLVLSNLALKFIMRFPKRMRVLFYKWYYSYDWRIEKL